MITQLQPQPEAEHVQDMVVSKNGKLKHNVNELMLDKEAENLNFFNLLIVILSIYILLALIADTFFNLPPETSILLNYIDNVICIVFLIDFVLRFKKAENKLSFMKWGWIDLLASIPTLDFMRAGRIIRLIRILRLIRAYKSLKILSEQFLKNKTQSTLTSISLLAVIMILFSSIAILQFENTPESNIKTAEDAIWWAYVTITTVGYGDKYPVTTEGRIIAGILMLVGVGLFGSFTAYVASWFVKNEK